jgi:hypothetical protein
MISLTFPETILLDDHSKSPIQKYLGDKHVEMNGMGNFLKKALQELRILQTSY